MSGQPFLHMVGGDQWHPRDVDTFLEFYRDQASEARLEQKRAEFARQQGGG